MQIGSIYKSNQEIKERKAELKERKKNRLNPEETKKKLIDYLTANKKNSKGKF